MGRLLEFVSVRWQRQLAPAAPTDVAMVRLLTLAGVALYYQRWFSLPAWGEVSDALWLPISFFRWLGLGPASPSELRVVELSWYASMTAGALGLWQRVSLPLAAATSLLVLGYEGNFGKPYHHANLFVLLVCILAAARCADALSVDEWLRRRRGMRPAAHSPVYAWPLALGRLLFLLFYFEAGAHKLMASGLAWVTSRNVELSIRLAETGTADALVQRPLLLHVLAVVVLALELGCITCVLWPRLSWIFVPGLFLMQLGFHYFMAEHFVPLLFCYALWVPWSRLLARIRRAWGVASSGDRPLRVQRAGKARAVGVAAIALTCVCALQLLTRRDDWPFSSFPMYASTAGPQLVQDQLFIVDAAGVRSRAYRLALEPFDDHRLSVALTQLSAHSPARLQRALDDVLLRQRRVASGSGVALEFRRLTWNNLATADLDHPDEDVLLARAEYDAALRRSPGGSGERQATEPMR